MPEKSLPYCLDLWKTHRIHLVISKPRSSVYGNYSFRSGVHYISVNGDLNPQAFLVTFLHEVAHLMVRITYRQRTKPHGPEWQTEFRKIMEPMFREEIFRPEILEALKEHMKKPGASSCSDTYLHDLLMNDGKKDEDLSGTPIADLQPGTQFVFQGNRYSVMYQQRKRLACKNLDNHRIYLFQPNARVELLAENSLVSMQGKWIKLSHLPSGTQFKFHRSVFKLVEKRRTKILCEDLSNKLLYLIPMEIEVEVV